MKQSFSCDRCLHDQVQCKFNPAKQEKCRGCVALSINCVWTQIPKPRPPNDSYIKYLEGRARALEKHLKQVLPAGKLKGEIDGLLEQTTSCDKKGKPAESVQGEYRHPGPSGVAMQSGLALPILDTPAISRLVQQVRLTDVGAKPADMDTSDKEAIWDATLSTRLNEPRYYGQSSSEVLSRDASIFRSETHSNRLGSLSTMSTPHRRPEFWRPTAAETRLFSQDWSSCEVKECLGLELPPDDLMPMLLDAYFDNTIFPVIHRPLFEKQLKDGLHKHEDAFLRVVLLVCANGSRWCDDPRVLDERWPVSLSAGHRWFRQFEVWQKNLIMTDQLSLWDAQMLVLMSAYFCGSSASYGLWIVVGIAIRMMQDIGSHRERSHKTLESELHKRCFWSILFLDRFHSVNFARHGAMQDLDSDLDDVLEVDDELWSLELSAPPPVQPEGVPSKLSIFNQLISICRIYGRCLQTVYALERTKRRIGLDGPQGAVWMFNDINMRLSSWVRDLPSYLQSPHPSHYNDLPFVSGVATLWAVYYELVISANRPFITNTSLAVPCMKICCEAAHKFANIIDAYRNTPGSSLIPGMYHTAFSSAMILLVDLIGQGRTGRPAVQGRGLDTDTANTGYTIQQKEEDARKAIQVLEWAEKRFQIAGRLLDMVREFEGFWRLRSRLQYAPSSSLPSKPHVGPSLDNVKQEPEATFDISGPPDTDLATSVELLPQPQHQDSPQTSKPPSKDFATYSASPDTVLPSVHLANSSHLMPEHQSVDQLGSHTMLGWHESDSQSTLMSAIFDQTSSFTPDLYHEAVGTLGRPELGYNDLNVLQHRLNRRLEHIPSLPRPEMLYTDDFIGGVADWNVASATAPNGDNLTWDPIVDQWNVAMLHALDSGQQVPEGDTSFWL